MIARILKQFSTLRSNEQGQAFVELCLVLPLLLSIVFGVIEIGNLAGYQEALQNSAHDGARVGSTWGCAGSATCETNNAKAAAAQAIVASDLKNCSPNNPPTITAPVTTAVAADGSTNQYITVTVSCTYSPITPLGGIISMIGSNFSLNLTRSAFTKMRVAQ